jgi:hypothetical protein
MNKRQKLLEELARLRADRALAGPGEDEKWEAAEKAEHKLRTFLEPLTQAELVFVMRECDTWIQAAH